MSTVLVVSRNVSFFSLLFCWLTWAARFVEGAYHRKSDYEVTKIQKRLCRVCFISFAAGKPEMSLADSTRSLIVNFFWLSMIKAERRGGRT